MQTKLKDIIKQKWYPDLEIDNSEKDIIQLWQDGKEEANVIQVTRENLHILIHSLASLLPYNKIDITVNGQAIEGRGKE